MPMQKPFIISAAIFVVLGLLLTAIVLWANQGVLTFVLDDALIHLAVAENIGQGSYGINAGEPASPSSSIIWPFLLALPLMFISGTWLVWALNFIFLLLSLYQLAKIVKLLPVAQLSQTILLIAALFIVNAWSLLFIGMEHGLQLYCSLLIVHGMLQLSFKQMLSPWPLLAIVLAPLVRYECMAISVAAVFLLWLHGYKKQAILTLSTTLILLISFSLYLDYLGLPYLPTSVLLKSASQTGFTDKLLEKVTTLLITPKAYILFALLVLFVRYAFNKSHTLALRKLSASAALLLALFLLFGKFGWYYRYEIFAWISALVFALVLFAKPLEQHKRKFYVLIFVLSLEHILVTLLIPFAANNIYLQQYQMGRFVKDYYPQAVAVNDIGWVAYQNPQHVLDLWGLASYEALKNKNQSKGVSWMQSLAAKHNTKLAMLYYSNTGDANGWFEQVPASWQPIGELKMTAMGVSVSKREVVFFAIDTEEQDNIKRQLQAFAKTLPPLSEFVFY